MGADRILVTISHNLFRPGVTPIGVSLYGYRSSAGSGQSLVDRVPIQYGISIDPYLTDAEGLPLIRDRFPQFILTECRKVCKISGADETTFTEIESFRRGTGHA